MLLQLPEWLKKNADLRRIHEGTIVDNIDPMFLGRVKATVPGLLEGEAEQLPWIYPITPTFLGGGVGSLMFFVPEINSKVAVWFPAEEVYFGFYIGHFHTEATHDPQFEEDYPESYGFKDSKGTYILINKAQGYMKIFHQSGSSVTIGQDGAITIAGADGITVSAAGDVSETVQGDKSVQARSVRIIADGEVNIQALGRVVVGSAMLVQLGSELAISGVVHELGYCPILGTHVGAGSLFVKSM